MVVDKEKILMDDDQIPSEESRRIGAEYASMCLERPVFTYRFTDWDGDQAKRLAQSRRRLLDQFDLSHETTLEDVVGLELAECWLAHGEKRIADARRHLERAAAAILHGIRYLRLMEDGNDSNG